MAKVRHDKLIAALIAKLPSPADGAAQWRQEHRITWLQMMAMAFDAVYGRCGGIAIAATTDAALPGVASRRLSHRDPAKRARNVRAASTSIMTASP
jgi:hypothetical protein